MAVDTWTAKANMPETRAQHAAGRDDSGYTYVLRGRSSLFASGYTVYSSVQMLDHVADTWTAKANAPLADFEGGYITRNEDIHCLGGNTGRSDHRIFNGPGNAWSQYANLPNSLRFGNFTGYFPSDDSVVYLRDNLTYAWDPGTDTWTQKGNKPRLVQTGPRTSPTLDGYMYCYMGNSSGAQPWVDRFRLGSNTWEQMADAPIALYEHTSVQGGSADTPFGYVFGHPVSAHTHYQHDARSETWTQKADLPLQYTRYIGAVAMTNGPYFHATGGGGAGSNAFGNKANAVYEATPPPGSASRARRWVAFI